MDALRFYSKFLAMLIILSLMVFFNFAVWGVRRHPEPPAWYVPHARPERAPALIASYGCGSCHSLSGVPQATGRVGPRLDRVREQVYLAGTLPNTPPNMLRWIREPEAIRPETLMRNLGVSEEDARDIAAFLYSQ